MYYQKNRFVKWSLFLKTELKCSCSVYKKQSLLLWTTHFVGCIFDAEAHHNHPWKSDQPDEKEIYGHNFSEIRYLRIMEFHYSAQCERPLWVWCNLNHSIDHAGHPLICIITALLNLIDVSQGGGQSILYCICYEPAQFHCAMSSADADQWSSGAVNGFCASFHHLRIRTIIFIAAAQNVYPFVFNNTSALRVWLQASLLWLRLPSLHAVTSTPLPPRIQPQRQAAPCPQAWAAGKPSANQCQILKIRLHERLWYSYATP